MERFEHSQKKALRIRVSTHFKLFVQTLVGQPHHFPRSKIQAHERNIHHYKRKNTNIRQKLTAIMDMDQQHASVQLIKMFLVLEQFVFQWISQMVLSAVQLNSKVRIIICTKLKIFTDDQFLI